MEITIKRKLTRSGHVNIPQHLRSALSLTPGDEFDVTVDGKGNIVLRREHGRCNACGSDEFVKPHKMILLCAKCRRELVREGISNGKDVQES